jgi:hypothetical protein
VTGPEKARNIAIRFCPSTASQTVSGSLMSVAALLLVWFALQAFERLRVAEPFA